MTAVEGKLPQDRCLRWWAWSWGGARPIQVLLMGEDPSVRRSVALRLRNAGYRVVEAGKDQDPVALGRVSSHPDAEVAAVDVIVANAVALPSPAAEWRADDASAGGTSSTPVLWIGRPPTPGDGADSDPETICEAVARLVRRSRTHRPPH